MQSPVIYRILRMKLLAHFGSDTISIGPAASRFEQDERLAQTTERNWNSDGRVCGQAIPHKVKKSGTDFTMRSVT